VIFVLSIYQNKDMMLFWQRLFYITCVMNKNGNKHFGKFIA